MNQSIVLEQPVNSLVDEYNQCRIISLSKFRMHQRAAKRQRINMLKQRLSGSLILVIGTATLTISSDATALIFLSMFALPMMFSKKYIMLFK